MILGIVTLFALIVACFLYLKLRSSNSKVNLQSTNKASVSESPKSVDMNNSYKFELSSEQKLEAEDEVRLGELGSLKQVITALIKDSSSSDISLLCNGHVDSQNSCFGSSIVYGESPKSTLTAADGSSWIKINLKTKEAIKVASVPDIPIDRVNNQTYHYVYCANNEGWEINTVLGSKKFNIKMSQDGGDNNGRYEVGSNLLLIDNTPNCKY